LTAGLLLFRPLSDSSSPRPADAGSATAFDKVRFDHFALLWLGDSFEGQALNQVIHEFGGPTGGQEMVTFIYGDCQMKNRDTPCPAPLQITVYGGCGPDVVAHSFRGDVPVRGIGAKRFGPRGHLFLHSGQSKIIIISTADDSEEQVARASGALRGVNNRASSITPDSLLDAPATNGFCQTTTDGVAPVSGAPVANGCCSIQLDMDPATPGVQASRTVSGPEDINVDVVLGNNVGTVGAFNMIVLYDDTILTPGLAGGGGLNGNPDFNEAALGGTWNCGLGGSPSSDVDGATGPLHGAAFLSCFNAAGGASVTSPTVVATLRLHSSAPVTTNITFGDVHFSHDDTTDIGSCDGGATGCIGSSVLAP
jgi:hypothetical protein